MFYTYGLIYKGNFMTSISLIAAMANNHVIGRNNSLPWHLPADLNHFKNVTMGKPIVMGRKTFESIGKPLPGRQNIIVTHDKMYQATGCTIINSIDHIKLVSDALEIMVIGGAEIYKQLLPQAQRLYLTYVHTDVTGDSYFPQWQANEWQEISREDHLADENNKYDYSFVILEKIN